MPEPHGRSKGNGSTIPGSRPEKSPGSLEAENSLAVDST